MNLHIIIFLNTIYSKYVEINELQKSLHLLNQLSFNQVVIPFSK